MAQQTILLADSDSVTVAKHNSNYNELYTITDSITDSYVTSVAGRAGAIQLQTSDVAGAASISYVNSTVSSTVNSNIAVALTPVVGSPPVALNSLQKIATAINNDPAYSVTIQAALNQKLGLSGGVLTGAVTSSRQPVDDLELVTKKYVDDRVVVYVKATNSTLGLVQVGNNLTIDGNGVISADVSAADVGAVSAALSAGLALKANQTTTYTKTEVDDAIATRASDLDLVAAAASLSTQIDTKAAQATTYTKTEVDGLVAPLATSADVSALSASTTAGLALKANQATTYTKTEVDGLVAPLATSADLLSTSASLSTQIDTKAAQATTYTKTEVDGLVAPLATSSDLSVLNASTTAGLALKANQATTYTKIEVDNELALLATSADLVAAAASLSDLIDNKADQSGVYTKAEVDNTVALLSTIAQVGALSASVTASLALKANQATTYTKTEVNGLIAPLATTNALIEAQAGLVEMITAVSGAGVDSSMWVIKNSAYTATNGDRLMADTSGAAFTITLPATPSRGNNIIISDYTNSFATNNLTVGRNGSLIENSASDLVIDVKGTYKLEYVDSTKGWAIL
jgi:hypothetical protein